MLAGHTKNLVAKQTARRGNKGKATSMVHLKQLVAEPDSRQAMFVVAAWSISNSWSQSQTVDRPWEHQKEERKGDQREEKTRKEKRREEKRGGKREREGGRERERERERERGRERERERERREEREEEMSDETERRGRGEER